MNQFRRETIAVCEKVPKTLVSDIKFKIDHVGYDLMEDLLTHMMYGNIYSKMADERVLTYYAPKPTFFDWLFGRIKKVEFQLKVKDLLINPPQKGTIRTYEVDML